MSVQVRFRHVSGDLGPYPFDEGASILSIKEKLLGEWPTDGPIAKEPPLQAVDIKLILSGKFLEDNKLLKEYNKEMGERDAETLITMHVTVRPSSVPKKQQASGGAPKQDDDQSKGCGCIIS